MSAKVESARELRTMLESRAWKSIEDVARSQIANRLAEVRVTPTSVESLILREHLLAECNGIELFLTIAPTMLEELEREIAKENTNGN